MKSRLCENKVLKPLDVFLVLAAGLLMVRDSASYSWLPGCDLFSKASVLEQIVPCSREYRICRVILAALAVPLREQERESWPMHVHIFACVHIDMVTLVQVNTHTHSLALSLCLSHTHIFRGLSHSWLVPIRDIQHSLVNVCLCSLARKRTLCECVFTSQL